MAAQESGTGNAPGTGKVRKRLSVVSDNVLIEGLEKANLEVNEVQRDGATVITEFYGKSEKGYAPYNPRKANQDVFDSATDEKTGSLLFVVMDGHGEFGHKVSGFLKNLFSKTLFAEPSFADDVPAALREAVRKSEAAMLKSNYQGGLGDQNEFSGTTFVATVIRGNMLWCANCGDSRLIVGVKENGTLVAKDVSEDHKPDAPAEKARIQAAGGRVFAVRYDDGIDGPARVWLAHADIPGLAMSRSLGDKVAHTAGVSSEPEIFELELQEEEHCFLVSASDGLWEFMTSQEVVDMAAKYNSTEDAVNELIKEAKTRWLREEEVIDDTTVVVACIGAWRGGN
mmetsp:Transcript_13748/g.16361  ORF Transcript_13748/g.16361 Transcript_13748/m.16361 type:complete len:341 (+) Transcript_13748:53-1075(+)|eukprot:CAMPEP_0114344300 /NCGR_PEP_ID=MMETSP0101-20121206/11310_1 /TAXON_ID=38822 ORGANISM="Pteridomonas danica, Strain PT" /NCGR_SAMPLE_ID=MMETSP0101 /ASSEMBLY_ACC=CAM_ASM_000211 /LENGTH=340 /DNA_ID=CAMNT_0001479567 /DNA_START=18 /DNA_END=1040 /DNA_ORIENTATION=-